MLVSDYDFDLPPELIAQKPAAARESARLLQLDRATGRVIHGAIADFPLCLRGGDLVVVNDTRVFPARLLGHRVPSGGAVECLLVTRLAGDGDDERWEALVHPGQKLKPGAEVVFEGERALRGAVIARRFFGRREIRLWTEDGAPVRTAIDRIGHMPLPPYIRRADEGADRERYQTMFASQRGSIAAPTAGLHFTERLIGSLQSQGVEIVSLTLHVGYGTFQPVRCEQVEDHVIEPEHYEISETTAEAVNRALGERRRIIAVGTTTTRTLEAVGREHGGRIAAGAGATGLFIYPGFRFSVVGGLLTNFHLPRSSLLMLVSAFAGRERVLAAYTEAIRARYRFYSYGDAMLLL